MKKINRDTTTTPTEMGTTSFDEEHQDESRLVWVNGAVIVGAGPSGLAVAAGLQEQGVPFVIIERADCIASLWQKRAYDRLKLHLPKQFCQLPGLPFPPHYPSYPSKSQFLDYLHSYAHHFHLRPRFNETVASARHDAVSGLWRVRTVAGCGGAEYLCRSLVVAAGENAEMVVPEVEGVEEFGGRVAHASEYKSGDDYRGKKVLVVGCGNSGMEVSLDLSNHNAFPSMVVRNSVHVLPREVMGRSTFEMAVFLLKWLPLWVVDKVLLVMAWLVLGDLEKLGIRRPAVGPLQLKNSVGKTPVLNIGTVEKIRSGGIEVVPGSKRFHPRKVELVDGRFLDIDAVVFATGYRSNVPSWLQENDFFSENGFPKQPFPNGWKGKDGLYAVGFTRRGLAGASADAVRVAQDIGLAWKEETRQAKQLIAFQWRR